MTNVTMLTYGRSGLTVQALNSLYINTNNRLYDLTIFNDEAKLGTGAARNKVIEMASQTRRDYLYLSDNDVYFKPKWLEILTECYEYVRENLNVIALGAYNHPYNPPSKTYPFYSTYANRIMKIGIVDALALQSWLWKWEDWEKYGPFDQTPIGRVRFSEDFAVSQKIRADGGQVAVVLPHLIYNCGITDSFGEKIPGWELIEKPEGVIVE